MRCQLIFCLKSLIHHIFLSSCISASEVILETSDPSPAEIWGSLHSVGWCKVPKTCVGDTPFRGLPKTLCQIPQSGKYIPKTKTTSKKWSKDREGEQESHDWDNEEINVRAVEKFRGGAERGGGNYMTLNFERDRKDPLQLVDATAVISPGTPS